jgi:hypothetical protein
MSGVASRCWHPGSAELMPRSLAAHAGAQFSSHSRDVRTNGACHPAIWCRQPYRTGPNATSKGVSTTLRDLLRRHGRGEEAQPDTNPRPDLSFPVRALHPRRRRRRYTPQRRYNDDDPHLSAILHPSRLAHVHSSPAMGGRQDFGGELKARRQAAAR